MSPRSYATEQSIEVDTASVRSIPGLKTPKKLWWLKEVTPDLHIAGRLTPRQIKYASEGGVKSIVSLYTYNDASKAGDDELPATQDAKRIAKKAGLNFSTVLPLKGKDEWASLKTVKKLGIILGGVSQPTIVHSDRGYSAAFVTLMHLAHRTRNDKTFQPRITSERFYTVAAVMGYDFTASNLKQIVAEVTGEPVVEDPPKPNADIKDWYEYWYASPVYKNWYTAGQIRKSQLHDIMKVGYTSVINMRPKVKTDGVPSQESVTLLNVSDSTLSYTDDKFTPRQVPETLKDIADRPS